ncbi:MAG TPA: ABC transporter substrate-binding protein [Stellaceae bacterium]|nr:ABC transporter substrate-binding protein [Stellaceae bacterium]
MAESDSPIGTTTTRRRVLAGAFAGAAIVAPAPLRYALAASKPYKLGTEQPLTGVAASGGKTALVGVQMAVDRINKAGGILGRQVELFVGDDESKPDTGRRAVEKLVTDDEIDAHVGGYLSNICLACSPVFRQHKVVNMIGVCLDTTLTTSKCNRYTFRPYDFAPAQAKAFAPYLTQKIGKKWHIVYADYAWGQSTRDAYAAELKNNGGTAVGGTGIPLGTADMAPFLSKITGDFDGLILILFGPDAITFVNQAYDLGLGRKYRWAGDGAVTTSTNLPAMGNKIEGFIGLDRYVPVFDPPLNTPYHHAFFDDAVARLKKIDPSGPLPDRYVQSNFEAVNCLKLGIEKSKFQGRADTDKLIAALEGLEMKEGYDFPQGDKLLRKEDHQAFVREIIFEIKGGKYHILDAVPKEKTIVPPACHFAV